MNIEALYFTGTFLATLAAIYSISRLFLRPTTFKFYGINEKKYKLLGLPESMQPNNTDIDSRISALKVLFSEHGRERWLRESFISSRLVTNKEYLNFLQDTTASVQGNSDRIMKLWPAQDDVALRETMLVSLNRIQSLTNLESPVVDISWMEAIAYCLWLTGRVNEGLSELEKVKFYYRLPIEAEWEKSAFSDSGNFLLWSTKKDQYFSDNEQLPWADYLSVDTNEIKKTNTFSENIWEWCLSPNFKYSEEELDIGVIKKAVLGKEHQAFTLISRGLRSSPIQRLPCAFRIVLDLNGESIDKLYSLKNTFQQT